ncbi:MAG TPA: T9SS type A sorting domain-containing protein [Bacteroidales bacterium]|nr:T9SS type A sorting domain-containing protein [Bacteroidales bacterium]HPS50841.1 T9SS type A sorting domain-containing protein [Bacteroidales bacterium]
MKKSLTLSLMVFILIGIHLNLTAQQSNTWVKQTITANSGKFEYSPPFNDFVNVQAYNPVNSSVTTFNTIFTQSAQDILINNGIAYVNAQDSIIKYNLNDFSRVAAIANSGLSKLALFHNRLIVSKQYPLISHFVDILDTADLSLVASVEGISGDCGGIACTADTVYVAVNGGWMGTVGKIAVIDPGTWTLDREIDLGAEAIGINNLFHYKNKIYSVNKTPYGMPAIGSISVYDPATGSFSNIMLGVKIGNATGIKDSILYAVFNEGIGAFNLNTMNIADTVVVPDPGSALFTYILSSCVDTINNTLHVNIGDYVTPGYCRVASLAGDSLTTYATGISTDAVAVDYRKFPLAIGETGSQPVARLSLFPNPVTDMLTLNFSDPTAIEAITITDINGRTLMNLGGPSVQSGSVKIGVGHLKAGIYAVVIKSSTGILTGKFIK